MLLDNCYFIASHLILPQCLASNRTTKNVIRSLGSYSLQHMGILDYNIFEEKLVFPDTLSLEVHFHFTLRILINYRVLWHYNLQWTLAKSCIIFRTGQLSTFGMVMKQHCQMNLAQYNGEPPFWIWKLLILIVSVTIRAVAHILQCYITRRKK